MKTQRDTDKKIIALIKMGDKILEGAVDGHQKQYINEKKFHDFRISALSFLSVTFGENSQFYKEFHREVTHPTPVRTERALGILTACQREVQGEWLTSLRAEIYGKFERALLLSAKKDLSEGRLHNALVLSSALLERHLHNLCAQNGIATEREVAGSQVPYTVVQLNSRAYKKGMYERKLNKAIFSWIELAKKADSEGVAEISKEEVAAMIDGVIMLTVQKPVEGAE